ncbi:jg4158 [Pararge aegeria aegeria]|uniref:Jg4158 protein n=1 Tax=Pararge aegeria aegeria TaxID=348720 RepID=A0A8S4RVE1_9NEOP|nr:jg4158 [Pararge aegeria aegeria]
MEYINIRTEGMTLEIPLHYKMLTLLEDSEDNLVYRRPTFNPRLFRIPGSKRSDARASGVVAGVITGNLRLRLMATGQHFAARAFCMPCEMLLFV